SQLFIKDEYTVALRTSDGQIKDVPTRGKRITAIGFDLNAKRFGIYLANGEIITGEVANPEQAGPPLTGATLETVLKIKDAKEASSFIRPAPQKGWNRGYDDTINDYLRSAIAAGIFAKYQNDDRALIGGLAHSLTDDINDAYNTLESGNQKDAIRRLQKAFIELNVPNDEQTVKHVLAENLFF